MSRRLAIVTVVLVVAMTVTALAYAGAPGRPPRNASSVTATAVSWFQINLTWVDNSSDESGFYIMRRQGQTGDFVQIDAVGPNSQSYADVTCSPSTEYCYQVWAYNQYGTNTFSPTACATTFSSQVPPSAPTGLDAVTISPTEIDLSWADNSNNETGFKIEVDVGNTGVFAYLDTVGADVTTYSHTNLIEGTTYCYRVYAYNSYGNSGYSNVDCAIPTGQPPAAPSGLDAVSASGTQINLSWADNSTTETGFKIEVDVGSTGTFAYLATVGAGVTTYQHTNLTQGTVYCYRVYAYNSYGNSAYSNTDCETAGGGSTVTVSTVQQLRDAVLAATPGTIIELTDGTYTWSDNTTLARIEDKQNLTIRSQSGNRDAVILKGQGISSATEFVFKLTRADYITIENLTMRDVYWHCVQLNEGSEHFTVRNCYMWDAGEGPIKSTVILNTGPFCDYGTVDNCVIGFTTTGKRSVVEGIDIIAVKGWVIKNTKFYNVIHPKPRNVAYGCFAKAASEDTVIENCYFQNCQVSISFGGGGSPLSLHRNGNPAEHYGGIMRNNIIHTGSDVGIYMNKASNFKIYNNTLWPANGFSSIDVRYAESYGSIINNICSEGYQLRDGGVATTATNLFNASASLFVNQAAANYHLASTATQAINQGTNTTADVAYDMDWEARPKGAAVDIGADEY
jgi:hypothetical protein